MNIDLRIISTKIIKLGNANYLWGNMFNIYRKVIKVSWLLYFTFLFVPDKRFKQAFLGLIKCRFIAFYLSFS